MSVTVLIDWIICCAWVNQVIGFDSVAGRWLTTVFTLYKATRYYADSLPYSYVRLLQPEESGSKNSTRWAQTWTCRKVRLTSWHAYRLVMLFYSLPHLQYWPRLTSHRPRSDWVLAVSFQLWCWADQFCAIFTQTTPSKHLDHPSSPSLSFHHH